MFTESIRFWTNATKEQVTARGQCIDGACIKKALWQTFKHGRNRLHIPNLIVNRKDKSDGLSQMPQITKLFVLIVNRKDSSDGLFASHK